MINIYTEKKNSKDWILQNDLYFNLNTGNEEMSQNEINLIQQVDEAKLTPDKHIETKYGLGFINFYPDCIIERCQTGKAIARQNPDFTEGRPKKYSRQQVQHALDLLESHSYKQVEQMTGISKSTLIRAQKALK